MILEGGSLERDNVYWMHKYSKIPIQSIINKYKDQFEIYTFNSFPSMTILKKINIK